jgi:hypothetical protein
VENYRSIVDTGEVSIAPVTCLVGKNEAGKTAILQALYRLNPVYESDNDYNDVIDYPRRNWSEYSLERRESSPDNIISATWRLEEDDIDALEELFGVGSITSPIFRVFKGYSNQRRWAINFNEEIIIKHILSNSGLSAQELQTLNSAVTIEELQDTLDEIDETTEGQNQLKGILQEKYPQGNASEQINQLILDRMPCFLYVPEYNTMPGKVSVAAFLSREEVDELTDEDRVFMALTRLASRSIEEIRDIQTFEELNAEMEAVSNRISQELFEYWTQDRHLHIDFRFTEGLPGDPPPYNSGKIFRTRIRNERHQVTVDFDERSTGFIWFFSFLVWFSQLKEEYGERLIILLDEPGLGLHAKAQEDLLRYINEKLSPKYQVVYSAHSPFMIDPNDLLRVRTVEDKFQVNSSGQVIEIQGTKVGDEVLSTDQDTVFPLQAALGFDITQTLFVGKHTILVEGPSDLLYLQWFSNVLRQGGRMGLDRRWVICPAGGIAKVGSFLALFRGNRLNVAVLSDFSEGIKGKVRELRESELLRQGHVFSAEMFVDGDEADIEDILGRTNYIHLVNEAYGLTGPNRVPSSKPADAPDRVIEEIKAKFRTIGPSIPEFNHFAPAEYLIAHSNDLQSTFPELEEALDRFETLNIELNKLIEPETS